MTYGGFDYDNDYDNEPHRWLHLSRRDACLPWRDNKQAGIHHALGETPAAGAGLAGA